MLDETKVKAREIMQTDVVTLHCDMPIRSAVETLEEYSISGAPVVDEAENLVGVLSSTDILKSESAHEDAEGLETFRSSRYYRVDPLEELVELERDEEDELTFSREDYVSKALGRETVADWMTPKIISVGPEASLGDVCTLMVREGVHRVFVVEGQRLLGVISSFDVVRSLANLAVA
jgi:CBS domain-containing protein